MRCRHCDVPLSKDEAFWFDDGCSEYERFRQHRTEERPLLIKSPQLAFLALRFHARKLRQRFYAHLRRANAA